MINKRLKDVLFSDQWINLCMDTLSPFGYVLVSELNVLSYLIIFPMSLLYQSNHLVCFINLPFPIYLICSGGVPANAGSAVAGFL